MGRHKRWFFAVLAGLLGVAMLPSPAAASGPAFTMVTTGLDSPRGVAFFNGKLVVAESGHGGSDCFTPPGNPFPICIGGTSRITSIDVATGNKTPLVTGLFSVSLGPEGNIGVSGLSAGDGRLLAQIGATPREAPPNIALAQAEAGQLISVRANGTWSKVAPVGAFDFDYTTQFAEPNPGCGQCPGTQEHDANPTAVLATDDGAFVADSGSNTLDRINEDGRIKIQVHDEFRDPNPHNFPSDAVPTCVAKTEDGLLVGELSGRVLRVQGHHFSVINNSLLSHITGCASDGRGNVFFVNQFGSGAPFTPPPASNFFIGNVVKFNVESGRASMITTLPFPYGDAIGPDGNLYVSILAICPSTTPPFSQACNGASGGVVKITLPHGDND